MINIVKLIALFFLCFISECALCQKMYVWTPIDISVAERSGFLDDEHIDLVVFDARTLTKNSKIECSSEELLSTIVQLVKKSIPSAKINILSSDNYYKASRDSVITLKISIYAYHSAFGSEVKVAIGAIGGEFSSMVFPEGKWNAITGYDVAVFDHRSERKKLSKKICKIHSKSNMMGYKTAKKALNSTFIEANQEMFSFFEKCFLE